MPVIAEAFFNQKKITWLPPIEFYSHVHLVAAYRILFTCANGSALALGAALAASGAPNTFQNLNVSSAAADATVQPSGL